MKILIVDDSPEKLKRLIPTIEALGVSRDHIDTVRCAHAARRKLSSGDYDLLILDIAIPLREEDEPSEQNAIELLNDIVSKPSYRRPRQIVGLTAYDELARKVLPVFEDQLWTVVHVDDQSDDWVARVRNCVDYLALRERQPGGIAEYDSDLCVICALSTPEHKALMQLPWNWSAARPVDDSTFVTEGQFASEGQRYSVTAATCARMGSVAAGILAAKLIPTFRPRFLTMTGICAGTEDECRLGDVILADASWDYQSGKHLKRGKTEQFLPAPHQLAVPEFIRSRADILRVDNTVWSTVHSGWTPRTNDVLRLHIGPVASGSAVQAKEGVFSQLRSQHRKLLGLDMEIYGLYAAAHYSAVPRPSFFAFKGVSDFADGEKDDSAQDYAAYTSTAALKIFCERYFSEIRGLAGT
jgi:nucleoside phosphorylase/CheY-like chemotaxis protein